MTTQYIRRAEGKINYQTMIPLTESTLQHQLLTLIKKNRTKEQYFSVYLYSKDDFKIYQETKTASGLEGKLTNRLFFDFDCKDDLGLALKLTRELFQKLLSLGLQDNQIQIYFSGGKGFHLECALVDKLTKSELKALVRNITFDIHEQYKASHPAIIDWKLFDEQRLFRSPLSPNSRGFKTPLTSEELETNTIEEILEIASVQDFNRYEQFLGYWDLAVKLPASMDELRIEKKEVVEVKNQQTLVSLQDRPDFTNRIKGYTDVKVALAQGFFEPGERNQAFMVLAATHKYAGFSANEAYHLLKATDENHVARLERKGIVRERKPKDEIWNEVISVVYSPEWKGGTYSEKEDPLLIDIKKKYNISEFESSMLVSLLDVNDHFKSFAKNIDQNTLKVGIPSLDANIRITTSSLVCLLAAPSAGKSSISFGILNKVSNDGIKSMFFSLDMAAPQVYQRLVQKHLNISSDTIFNAYKNDDFALISKIEKKLHDEYKNVKFCFRSGISCEQIRDALLEEKKATGEFPKLIVIDYLESVSTPYSDSTAAKGYVANQLKNIANDFGICVFLLVQPAKITGGPASELNSYTNIKGSSVVGEAATQVITLYRPGFSPKDPDDDRFLTLTVVKNRMGSLGQYDFGWDGLTGSISELTEEGRGELAALRREIEEEKKASKSDSGWDPLG